MTANSLPIFPIVPNVNNAGSFIAAVTAANTATDGTGTVSTIFLSPTGGNAAGSYIDSIEFRHAGTNVATVARIFLNNGSTNATAANNILIGEVTIGANTVSQTAASVPYIFPLRKNIPSGYKINFTLGTAVSAGILGVAFGMDL